MFRPWNKGKKGTQPANKGSFKAGEHRSPSTEFKKGSEITKHPRWKGGKPKCLQCGKTISYKAKLCNPHANQGKNKGKPNLKLRGEKSPLWRGGLTAKHLLLRRSFEYRLWREAVFKRDNYTCVQCGDSKGGNLEADHIKPFSLYPELRFAIDNGQTLCHSCHVMTPTYGGRIVNYVI